MPFERLIPRPFTSNAIEMYAPIASGVYGISNSGKWIYIGETDNIHDALLDHLQDVSASLMKHQPTGFVFELCEGTHRTGRQGRLVDEYGPACNGRKARAPAMGGNHFSKERRKALEGA